MMNQKFFFEKHKTILNNTSYFDECDNSIFAHYFNILYLIFTKNKISNSQIYLTNFNSFFLFHGKYLSIQDLALETPLHKIVKLRNKCFFLIYYDKLKEIGVVNEQILLIKNINNESCFDFIFKEMVINRTKLINKHFDIYIKFLKNNYVYISTLPIKAKLKIKLFSFSVLFDEKSFKDLTFDDIYSDIRKLFINLGDTIIEYNFFNPNINILNILFHYCV